MKKDLKYKLYINVVSITGETISNNSFVTGNTSNIEIGRKFGILSKKDNIIKEYNDYDFYINIPLFKKFKLEEYIDIKQEQNIEFINDNRQEFNPYFLEYSFFDTITSNKVNTGSFPLSETQTNYIASVIPDTLFSFFQEYKNNLNIYDKDRYLGLQNISDHDLIVLFFEEQGQYSLPWSTSNGIITLNDITSLDPGSLNTEQISFIRLVRGFDVTNPLYDTDYKVLKWFSIIGNDELPWSSIINNSSITIDDITNSSKRNDMIISKATNYPIDINN